MALAFGMVFSITFLAWNNIVPKNTAKMISSQNNNLPENTSPIRLYSIDFFL